MGTRNTAVVGLLVLAAVCAVGLEIDSCSSPLLVNNPPDPSAPANLADARTAVVQYYEYGKWDAEMTRVFGEVGEYFDSLTKTDNSTVIFDIDETTLSNYKEMKREDFGFIPEMNAAWVSKAKAPAIPQSLQLYQRIIKEGYKVIFSTGRSEPSRESTTLNLHRAGYTEYEEVILRDESEQTLSAQVYKMQRRIELAAMGYDIVANFGDQWSDVEGQCSGFRVKLPNYIYIVE